MLDIWQKWACDIWEETDQMRVFVFPPKCWAYGKSEGATFGKRQTECVFLACLRKKRGTRTLRLN